MEQIKKTSCLLALVLLLSLCLAVPAFGEESAVMWVEVQKADDGVTVSICANTTVTDGQIELHYDYRTMTYCDMTVDSQYVLAHAANPEKQGAVQIAWVAPGDYSNDGTKHVLMQLRFAGDNVDGFYVSGYVFTPAAEKIAVAPPAGFDRLQAAMESAKALKADRYSEETFAKLQAALEAARAELADPTVTEERLEAARQNVIDAVLGLLKPGEVPPAPSTTAPVATTPATTPGATDPQGSNTGLIIAIVAVCLVAAVVVVIVIKRKGSKV